MKKALLLAIIFSAVLLLGCSGGRKSCKADDDCESWKFCNTTSKACFAREGFCEQDSACGSNKVCNKEHKCEMKKGFCETTADCEDYQTCDIISGKCEVKIGFCSEKKFCLKDWETCNNATHRCVVAKGRCMDSLDCEAHQMCNASSNSCYPIPGRCDSNESCQRWQYCDMGKKACALRPGFCVVNSDCKARELCDSKEMRCYPRPLTESEKILVRIGGNGTTTYTLKEPIERTTLDSSMRSTVAEIPLGKEKVVVAFDAMATSGLSSSGIAEVFAVGLLDPAYVETTPLGEQTLSSFAITNTDEPTGVVRLDNFPGEYMLTIANWHVDRDWKVGTRMTLASLGIKPGERFRVFMEFDNTRKPGVLDIYVENNFGQRRKISSVGYVTYLNAYNNASVAAAFGAAWQGGPYSTPRITIRLEPLGWWNRTVQNYVPGSCIDESQCNPWELCNPINHMCYMKLGWCVSSTDCPVGYNCTLDPRYVDRRICTPIACGKNADCPGSTCDIELHLCRPVPPFCSPDNFTCYNEPRDCKGGKPCAPWETCDSKSGYCLTRMGMCGSDMDCPLGTVCELNPNKAGAHTCLQSICNNDSDCPGTTCDTYKHVCRIKTP